MKMTTQKETVFKQVQEIFLNLGISVSIDELNNLFNSDDWDRSAKEFDQKICNSSSSAILTWDVLSKIDALLASIDSRVSPGGFWWSAYDFAKSDHGHGLFTFNP